MVKYYVKISRDKPLEEDEALWFEFERDENDNVSDKEFFVVRRNEYEHLKSEFERTVEELGDSDIVTGAVNIAINDYFNDPETVLPLSESALQLQDSSDNTKIFNYQSIKMMSDSLDMKMDIADYIIDNQLISNSHHPVQNQVITEALEEKVNNSEFVSSVNGLQSNINNKSDKSHTHSGWTWKRLNDYATIYYNDSIRMCEFRYYRQDYNFTKTDSFILHTGLIPSAYRPKVGAVLPFYHQHLIGYIGDNGNFQIKSDTKAKYTINTRAVWHY